MTFGTSRKGYLGLGVSRLKMRWIAARVNAKYNVFIISKYMHA